MDLSSSNILTDGKSFVMTDVNRIEQTHLFFLDFFNLIGSLSPISEYLYNSLKKIEDTDEIKKLINDLSSHFINEEKIIAQHLFYRIDRFNMSLGRFKGKNEREQIKKFLKKTSSRYNSLISP